MPHLCIFSTIRVFRLFDFPRIPEVGNLLFRNSLKEVCRENVVFVGSCFGLIRIAGKTVLFEIVNLRFKTTKTDLENVE